MRKRGWGGEKDPKSDLFFRLGPTIYILRIILIGHFVVQSIVIRKQRKASIYNRNS